MNIPESLTEETLTLGLQYLSEADPDHAKTLELFGPPPMWAREQGFPTLLYIILEQQVSLASAKAAFKKLNEVVRPLTPEGFLKLANTELKKIGFSRQKAGYGRNLARLEAEEQFDFSALEKLNDDEARSYLTTLKGVGRWTADIYILEALLRPDVWPHGDLALAKAVQKVKNFKECPSYDELDKMSDKWRPWRAVAARLFWHAYLNNYDGF
jgi:DNA-3-methyladenine glycosylase II